LGFEVSEAELTGDTIGVALGFAQSVWTGCERLVDGISEDTEVADVNRRSWFNLLWSVLAAGLSCWGFGLKGE
jgi:hypothetical protein